LYIFIIGIEILRTTVMLGSEVLSDHFEDII